MRHCYGASGAPNAVQCDCEGIYLSLEALLKAHIDENNKFQVFKKIIIVKLKYFWVMWLWELLPLVQKHPAGGFNTINFPPWPVLLFPRKKLHHQFPFTSGAASDIRDKYTLVTFEILNIVHPRYAINCKWKGRSEQFIYGLLTDGPVTIRNKEKGTRYLEVYLPL